VTLLDVGRYLINADAISYIERPEVGARGGVQEGTLVVHFVGARDASMVLKAEEAMAMAAYFESGPD
jgi:hypothetical protein